MFFVGKPERLSLMLVGNYRNLPKSGTPEKYFTWVSSGLSHKEWIRLARDKHSSLLQKFINNRCKKFYNIGLRTTNNSFALNL